MRMTVAHTGRTGKATDVTFDTDKKTYCLARREHDVYIYAEQTRYVTGVITDLKNMRYRKVSIEEFGNYTPKRR